MSIGDCNILNNVNNAWICSFLGGNKKLRAKGHHYCNMFCSKSVRKWNHSVTFLQELNEKTGMFLYMPIPKRNVYLKSSLQVFEYKVSLK